MENEGVPFDTEINRDESVCMEKANPIKEKSYLFALHIIAFYKKLIAGKEFVLSKQLLRSGTSVGASVEEASQAQSKKDFIAKLSIALKEAHESHYWLRLLLDSGYATSSETHTLLKEVHEVISLLTAIIKTTKSNLP
ncbi:MAG: four helix bundle protein [Patescibacteria group bacterium]